MATRVLRLFVLGNVALLLLTCTTLLPRYLHRPLSGADVAQTFSQSASESLGDKHRASASSNYSAKDKWTTSSGSQMAARWTLSVRPFIAARPEVLLYTLTNGKLQASISSFGATVTRILVPDAKGEVDDVVLGFDDLQPYTDGTSPYFGAVVGRVANRIAQAAFEVDGKRYQLAANNGPNTLHGGEVGFDKVTWQSAEVKSEEGPSVRFSLLSPDGDQGFPGAVEVAVTYTLTSESEMRTEMEARALDKATPLNLAHHTYWNLGGHKSGTVLDHRMRIYGSHYTPVDANLIPTGEIAPVKGTPFDFTEEASIGSRIGEVEGGYDHNYVLDGPSSDDLKLAARVKEPNSGRVMELLTTAPGMQFYTGNFLDGSFQGKEGAAYPKHAAFCLETQGFPNAVNEPKFPSVVLRPGEVYRHVMLHRFSTEP